MKAVSRGIGFSFNQNRPAEKYPFVLKNKELLIKSLGSLLNQVI